MLWSTILGERGKTREEMSCWGLLARFGREKDQPILVDVKRNVIVHSFYFTSKHYTHQEFFLLSLSLFLQVGVWNLSSDSRKGCFRFISGTGGKEAKMQMDAHEIQFSDCPGNYSLHDEITSLRRRAKTHKCKMPHEARNKRVESCWSQWMYM